MNESVMMDFKETIQRSKNASEPDFLFVVHDGMVVKIDDSGVSVVR